MKSIYSWAMMSRWTDGWYKYLWMDLAYSRRNEQDFHWQASVRWRNRRLQSAETAVQMDARSGISSSPGWPNEEDMMDYLVPGTWLPRSSPHHNQSGPAIRVYMGISQLKADSPSILPPNLNIYRRSLFVTSLIVTYLIHNFLQT